MAAIALQKLPEIDETVLRDAINTHLDFAREHLAARIPSGGRILDFGCGIGHSVRILLTLGYEAYGADVAELWDRDYDTYWNVAEKPDAETASRLRLIETSPYRLPFPDDDFDFCFSDQVFEHVFDYQAVFAELRRVLKPGALSVHRFPGPGRLMEGHILLPSPVLCRSRAYLNLWALLGHRSPRQAGMGWRETAAQNAALMAHNNYPTKAQLREQARQAGVRIRFMDREEFAFRTGRRWASRLGPLLQRYMVLSA